MNSPGINIFVRKIEKVKEKCIDLNQWVDTASKGIGAACGTCR